MRIYWAARGVMGATCLDPMKCGFRGSIGGPALMTIFVRRPQAPEKAPIHCRIRPRYVGTTDKQTGKKLVGIDARIIRQQFNLCCMAAICERILFGIPG